MAANASRESGDVILSRRVTGSAPKPRSRPANQPIEVALPAYENTRPQNEEWVLVKINGEWREVRLHDYDLLYSVPGLYEKIVYELLGCVSPEVIRDMVNAELKDRKRKASDLRVLDLGAGNGIVAEELASIGVERLCAVDIIPEAKAAAERDRPGLYETYVVGDVTALSDDQRARLRRIKPNMLTCVAALGFGDIPPRVFTAALNLVEDGGLAAFTIKDDFLGKEDQTGFAALIAGMCKEGSLHVHQRRKYEHRKSIDGKPLEYFGIVATKHRDVSDELLNKVDPAG